MPSILRALPWAAATLFVAVAGMLDLISDAQTQTLIIAFPAVMIATMNAKPCALRRRSA